MAMKSRKKHPSFAFPTHTPVADSQKIIFSSAAKPVSTTP